MGEPNERDLDDAAIKAKLAAKLIQASRVTAKMMGVMPGSWMLALIEEMALNIVTQQEIGKTVQEGRDLVMMLLTETIIEIETNPRIGDDTPGIAMRIIPIETITGPREPDEVSELLARTIGKIER